MAVPNTFATSTSPIPLANLDANFAYYDNAFSISGTIVTYNGRIVSTIATGTAPFTVASTTPVVNLSIGGNAGSATNIVGGAVGSIAYQSAAGATTFLADVATGNAVISGGAGVAPSYGKIGLTTHVSGTLPVANGGTNLTTYTIGDIVYASAATTLSKLADVATGNALISGGVGAAPSYGKIGLTTHVTGILPVANGGTNLGSGTSGGVLYYSAAGTLASSTLLTQYGVVYGGGAGAAPVATAAGTTGQVLTATTSGAPTWANPATSGTVTSVGWTGGIVSVATTTTTPAFTIAGTSGGIPYFSSGTTWATSAALAANAIVIGGGAGVAPATTTTGTGVVTAIGNAVNNTNGLVTQAATLTASALLIGGGASTGIASTTTGTGVVTALGNNANATGGVVTVDGTATLTNKTLTNPTVTNYVESVVAIGNSGTTQTLALTNGTVQTITMTGNCTFTMPTATAGKSFILIVSTGAGGFTGTFTSVKWPSNTAPTLTTTATRWDILTFIADGTNWYGTFAQAFQ
jgi:hypothetical protein